MEIKEKLIEVFMHLDRHIQNRDEYGICYTSDFVEAVEDVLEMLKNPNNVGDKPSPTATGWISVKDRLPEKGEIVLACGKRHATSGMFQGASRNNPKWWHWKGNTLKEVTHWMPLPEPPTEEAQPDCTYNKNGHCMGQKLMPECDAKNCDRRK